MKTLFFLLLLATPASAQTTLDLLPTDALKQSYRLASNDVPKLRAWLGANSRNITPHIGASAQLDFAALILEKGKLCPRNGQLLNEVSLAIEARKVELKDVDVILGSIRIKMPALVERVESINAARLEELEEVITLEAYLRALRRSHVNTWYGGSGKNSKILRQ